MKNICIVANSKTRASSSDVDTIINEVKAHGGTCTLLRDRTDGKASESGESFIDLSSIPDRAECAIVLGGDGTIIQTARQFAGKHIPILGINLGTLGFLADAERNNIKDTVAALLADKCTVEERLMLSGEVVSCGKVLYESNALNDIVVARSGVLRVISTEVSIDENMFGSFRGDGIIVSTPTGSTGYNLSAGGPILMPGTKSIAVTPICPHSFGDRGIVAPCTSEIRIDVVQSKKTQKDEAIVSFDGNRGIRVNTGDHVLIRKAVETVSFIRTEGYSFLNVLREKMR